MLPLEGAADLLYPCLPPAWQTPMLKVRPYTAQDEVRNRAIAPFTSIENLKRERERCVNPVPWTLC